MRVLQQQLHLCISAGDFMALVHLYIGLHRFDESEFLLDALADNDQFELILSVGSSRLICVIITLHFIEICHAAGGFGR